MKRKIRCKLGIHRPIITNNEIKLWRWNDHYFDIMEKCQDCGEMVVIGNIEAPLPMCMETLNFKILND